VAGQHSQISAISRETSQYAFFVRTHQAAEGNIVPWRNGLHGKNLAQSETLCTWGSSLHGTWEDGSKTEMSGLARHARFTLRSRHHQPAPACPFGSQDRTGGFRNRQKHDIDRVSRADQRRVPIDQSAVGRPPRRDYRVVTSAASHPPRRSRPQRLPNRPCS
jgi:hypothetical protein